MVSFLFAFFLLYPSICKRFTNISASICESKTEYPHHSTDYRNGLAKEKVFDKIIAKDRKTTAQQRKRYRYTGGKRLRSIAKLMQDWQFTGPDGKTTLVELPHTWNAKDGQDGGNDYWRGTCTYSTTFAAPACDAASQEVWLQFEGVNSSAKVLLNGRNICPPDGGCSTFRVHVSDLLAKDNQLTVEVDNSVNDRIYPQKADFTFYGGIYRDLSLMVVTKNHNALGHFGDTGGKITPVLKDGKADIRVETLVEGEGAGSVELQDAAGSSVARAEGADALRHLDAPFLWDGVKYP